MPRQRGQCRFCKNAAEEAGFLGIKSFRDYESRELANYIDWTPFFQTWELTGRYSRDPR